MRCCQCPEPDCQASFDVAEDAVMRPQVCPACKREVRALPLGILEELRTREPGTATEPGPRAVVLDGVRSEYNVGSIFRTADAAGWPRLYLTGITAPGDRRGVAKTALGAQESVAWSYHVGVAELLDELGRRGVHRVALEHTSVSQPVPARTFEEPLVLVAGNEVSGLSPQALRRCDDVVHIPMHGRKSSLNVAVAVGVALYSLEIEGETHREDEGKR